MNEPTERGRISSAGNSRRCAADQRSKRSASPASAVSTTTPTATASSAPTLASAGTAARGRSPVRSRGAWSPGRRPARGRPSLAQAICGWMRPPRPQSVAATTFSRPTTLGEAHDAVGDQLGMLDHVGGVTDHARDEHLALRQLDVLPDAPLVLVAHVGRLEGVRAGVDLEHERRRSRPSACRWCADRASCPSRGGSGCARRGRSRMAWLSASISRLVYRRYSSGVGAGVMRPSSPRWPDRRAGA